MIRVEEVKSDNKSHYHESCDLTLRVKKLVERVCYPSRDCCPLSGVKRDLGGVDRVKCQSVIFDTQPTYLFVYVFGSMGHTIKTQKKICTPTPLTVSSLSSFNRFFF